jgi:RimJ/RimL family protein N-acetyltransferase
MRNNEIHQMTEIRNLSETTTDDFGFIGTLVSDEKDFEKIFGSAFSYPLTKDQFEKYFIENAGRNRNRMCFVYRDLRSSFGMINFTRIDWKNDFGHLGMIAIDPLRRSNGIGKAMVQAALAVGFNELKFNRIDLYCIEENVRGYKFYTEKCGFRNEGLARCMYKNNGQYKNWYVLSIIRSEYQKLA